MACRRLPYYHRFLHRENFSSPLKVVYRRPLKEEKGCWDKYQWDLIHNPESVLFSWLEDEGEGEVLANTYYWTPAGTPIYMPSAATTLLDIVKINNKSHVNGILYSWKEGTNTTYVADIDPINNEFYGYIKSGTSEKYSDVTNLKAGDKIPVNSIMYIGNCTKEDVINDYTITENIIGASYYTLGKPLITEFLYTNGKKANALPINNCSDNIFTGKAKDFKEYCTGKFNSDQTVIIDKTAGQIQLMGDFYDDYEKLVLSTNPYATWVNSTENLEAFNKALEKYYEEHKNAQKVDNPNCDKCPKYPVNGDAYWDDQGRNWVLMDNKWRDLSGEFCDGEGCNNEWKQGLTTEQIQLIHKTFYEEEIAQRQNHWMQAWVGGINDEFKTNFYRMTQFATIKYLKTEWVEEELGNKKWIPVWGNIEAAALNASVANGDMTFYTKAAGSLALAAADAAILKAIVQNLVKTGVITIVKNAAKEELSLLKTFFSQKNVMITASGITLLNIGTQFTGNCFTRGDAGWALRNIDIFDALADGALATVTMNGSTLYQLFGKSSKVYIFKPVLDKMSKVFVIEFVKVNVDITQEDGVMIKQFFNDDIDAYNAFALFVIAMASDKIPVKDITNELILWSKANVSTFSKGLSATARPIFDRMDEIVKTEGFKLFADQQSEVIEQIVQNIIDDYFEDLNEERLKVQVKMNKLNTDKSFEDLIRDTEKLPANSKIPEDIIIDLHE
jgi:hypothetical protein